MLSLDRSLRNTLALGVRSRRSFSREGCSFPETALSPSQRARGLSVMPSFSRCSVVVDYEIHFEVKENDKKWPESSGVWGTYFFRWLNSFEKPQGEPEMATWKYW